MSTETKSSATKAPVVILGVTMTLALMGTYSVPFVIGSAIDALSWTASAAGMLGTIELGSIAIGGLVSSALLRPSHNVRLIVVIALLVGAAMQFLSAHMEHAALLMGVRGMAGLTQGVVLSVTNTLIATSRQPESTYGQVFTVTSSCFALLLFVIPYALSYAQAIGIFYLLGALTLLGAMAACRLPSSCHGLSGPLAEEEKYTSLTMLTYFFVVLTVVFIILGGTWAFSERSANQLNIESAVIGLILGCSTLAGIVGAATAAKAGTRWGHTLPVALGFIALGITVITITGAAGVYSYAAGIIAYGFLYMFVISYVLGIASHFDNSGRIAAGTNAFILIPYSLGPVLFGYVGMSNMFALGWWCGLACLLAAIAAIDLLRRLNLPISPKH